MIHGTRRVTFSFRCGVFGTVTGVDEGIAGIIPSGAHVVGWIERCTLTVRIDIARFDTIIYAACELLIGLDTEFGFGGPLAID